MTIAHPDFALRPLIAGDAPRIAELIGDWEVVRWLSGPPHPYKLADAVEFLKTLPDQAKSGACHHAIVIAGQFAGAVGIDFRHQEPNAGRWNLGYWIGRTYWGHGIMTRAATRLTHDFFANSSETKLKSGYFSGNEASWAIQKRLGFEMAGEGLMFSRSQGKRLPHVETVLTRARFELTQHRAKSSVEI